MFENRTKLGGLGIVIQVDECLLRGSRKNNKGRLRLADLPAENLNIDDDSVVDENVNPLEHGARNYGKRLDGPWVFGLCDNKEGRKITEICKIPTNFRMPIPPSERLAIALSTSGNFEDNLDESFQGEQTFEENNNPTDEIEQNAIASTSNSQVYKHRECNDPDKHLLSLLPDYKNLNDSQKLDFRINALNFFLNAQQSQNRPFQSVNDVENTDDTIENNICDEPEPTSSSNNCNTLDSWITNISNISNISTTSTPIRKFERSSSETKCLSASSFTSSTLSNISTMQTFVDKVTKDEKLKLDSMLAKAIYASGSPLSLLDNIYWKKLFEKIRPAYVLPSSYQLSNKLLDSEVNGIKCFVEKLIVGSHCLGLMCDDERCEEDIIPSVKQCINNDTFWDRIKNLHNFLKPIAYWITRIESDLPQLSIVPEIFVEIKKQYDTCIKNVSCFETEKNVIKNKIQSRKEFSVRQIHLAANVLHPKYRGNNLTADENIEAATFIHRLSTICLDIDEQKVMYDFAQYKLKEEQERQVNPPLAQQDYYEKLLEEFEEDSNNELQLEEIEEDSNNELQLEEIECEDNTKESDCSVISVNLENEEEENSDIDIDSTEIDELMNMISS
ncbi:hypothetical protein ACI65C_005015 [Semiaphis heraclei]